MKTVLSHIANIQTGIFAKTVSEGDIVYLQVKHFNEDGKPNSVLRPDLKIDKHIDKHLLQTGDVLFAAKGVKNFAAVYEQHNIPAVASTSFFVIRLTQKNILPEFLSWFLNHPTTQSKLKNRARGTSIVSISKKVLDELEISAPSIEMQQNILKIASLRKLEHNIKQQMDELKEKYVQSLLIESIN